MAQRSEEANRLWKELLTLERETPGAGEDKQAFFKRKKRRGDELRTAYNKATGVNSDPNNTSLNEQISNQQLGRGIFNEPGSSTRDSLG